MEGKGIYVCPEGSRYEGDFRTNHRHGWGTCQWGNRHGTPFRFVGDRYLLSSINECLEERINSLAPVSAVSMSWVTIHCGSWKSTQRC